MTTPEYNQQPDQPSENHEQSGDYQDITTKMSQLQSDFIDSLAFGNLNYIDEKIGHDFSRLDWLNRGDELIADGNLSVMLTNDFGEQHFAMLGEQSVLNGYALRPYVMKVPVIEALPPATQEYDTLSNTFNQWSLTIELAHAVAAIYDPSTQTTMTELIGEKFRVFLPLVYPTTLIERYVPDEDTSQ